MRLTEVKTDPGQLEDSDTRRAAHDCYVIPVEEDLLELRDPPSLGCHLAVRGERRGSPLSRQFATEGWSLGGATAVIRRPPRNIG